MNTPLIQVDYDSLSQIATHFKGAAQQIEQMHQATSRSVNQLEGGGWIGRGANAFFSEMRGEIFPAVQRLAQALAEANLTTQQIIQILQQADEEAAHPFDGAGASIGRAVGSARIGGAWKNGGFVQQLPGILNDFGDRSFGSGGNVSPIDLGSWNGGLTGGGYGLPQVWSGSDLNSPWSDFVGSNYNDYGIPNDWLSGGPGGGTTVNDWGIPSDWLGDVTTGLDQDMAGTTPIADSGETSAGGSGSFRGVGGSSGAESEGSRETIEQEPTMPIGDSGAGGSTSPETIIREPYGSPHTGPRDFDSGGAAAAAGSDGFRYHAVSGSTGSSSMAPVSSANVSPGAVASDSSSSTVAETGNKAAGIPFGIMAASPFMALLGKMVMGKTDNK